MTPDERDRLTRLEVAGNERGDDIREIKDLLKTMDARLVNLERVASSGKGALHSALWIGGIIGWLVGIILSVAHAFHH